MSVIRSTLDTNSEVYKTATSTMNTKLAEIEVEHAKALAGGGEKYTERHHKRGKLLARERIELLLDQDSPFLELCPSLRGGVTSRSAPALWSVSASSKVSNA